GAPQLEPGALADVDAGAGLGVDLVLVLAGELEMTQMPAGSLEREGVTHPVALQLEARRQAPGKVGLFVAIGAQYIVGANEVRTDSGEQQKSACPDAQRRIVLVVVERKRRHLLGRSPAGADRSDGEHGKDERGKARKRHDQDCPACRTARSRTAQDRCWRKAGPAFATAMERLDFQG